MEGVSASSRRRPLTAESGTCVCLFQDIVCLQSKVLLVLGARCLSQANGRIGKRVRIPHGPATVTPTSGFAPFPQ